MFFCAIHRLLTTFERIHASMFLLYWVFVDLVKWRVFCLLFYVFSPFVIKIYTLQFPAACFAHKVCNFWEFYSFQLFFRFSPEALPAAILAKRHHVGWMCWWQKNIASANPKRHSKKGNDLPYPACVVLTPELRSPPWPWSQDQQISTHLTLSRPLNSVHWIGHQYYKDFSSGLWYFVSFHE